MAAVPANIGINLVTQDNRGYRALSRIEYFDADISIDTTIIGAGMYTKTAAIVTAFAAMTNAKVVQVSFDYKFDYAQEPSSETGTYELVIQKANMRGGDGNGGSMRLDVPAPKDAMFLSSGTDNLIVLNPSSSLITAFQSALSASTYGTARGGEPFAQFYGGQLIQGKPRRRRVVQGA